MEQTIKILYIIPSIDYGGAELQTIQQVNYLHEQKQLVYLLVLSKVKNLREELSIPNNHLFELNYPFDNLTFKSMAKSYQLLSPIHQIIKQAGITHVLAHLPLSHVILRLVKLLFFHQFQLLPYHHSMQYEANPLNTISKKVFNSFQAYLSYWVDNQHIFVSKAVEKNIKENFIVKRSTIIYNAIPFQKITHNNAKSYVNEQNLDTSKFIVVIPGRLHPAKGHLFFIKAFEKLKYQFDWQPKDLLIIFAGGNGAEKSIRQTLFDKQLTSFFHVTGSIPNQLLLSFYKLANLVVIPSIHEAFGVVAIEALMQESLILCSDTGGLPEIIQHQHNGFVFKTLDEADFMQQFIFIYQQLLRNSKKKLIDTTILQAAYKERFTLASQMKQVVNSLESIAPK